MEEVYNEAASFWQGLKREVARAIAEKAEFLSTPGIAEADLDLSHRSLKGGFVWRYFWGAHQRFFRDLCIASKVPATIEQAQQALEQDK
ncbi:unnamed protein product, partial [Hapterophycus canaliculatus]